MSPSQVSGIKMRNLLFGVILGLVAVVHSSTVETVTPTKTKDDILREVFNDGFLLPSLTTKSAKRNTTVPASQQPSSGSTKSDMIEGSGLGETTTSMFPHQGNGNHSTTTQIVSHTQSSTSTVSPKDDSSTGSSTTQSPQSTFTSSSVPNKAQSSSTTHHISVSSTTDTTVSSVSSDLGSGDGEILGQFTTTSSATSSSVTSSSSTETSTSTSSTSTAAPSRSMVPGMFEESGSGSGSGVGAGSDIPELKKESRLFKQETPLLNNVQGTVKTESQPNTAHTTPGWIIIVGFIVGVAALVMLCVAIATRDKWNGPKQASQPEAITNSSNQQRELEMETFLNHDKPRENGKAAEYTVIPLDELPEKHSSQ